MKRLLFFGMLLLCSAAWAQTADSVARGRVLGDEPQERRSRERNVLGAPVYYDTLGNVIGQKEPADSVYHRPKHHFRNRLEDEFCAFFLEGQAMLHSNRINFGGQLAWIPQRWGVYGSSVIGPGCCHLSLGPVWRVSDCGNRVDCQIYGGLASELLSSLGAEVGIRLAAPKQWSDFCWTSVSVTVGHVHETNYVILGFSLALTSLAAITIW